MLYSRKSGNEVVCVHFCLNNETSLFVLPYSSDIIFQYTYCYSDPFCFQLLLSFHSAPNPGWGERGRMENRLLRCTLACTEAFWRTQIWWRRRESWFSMSCSSWEPKCYRRIQTLPELSGPCGEASREGISSDTWLHQEGWALAGPRMCTAGGGVRDPVSTADKVLVQSKKGEFGN